MKRRGFSLITVLLLSSMLLVLAVAMLVKESHRYKGARLQVERAQARALAWAGIETVRARLDHDYTFPPVLETELPPDQAAQRQYSFEEAVYAPDSNDIVGSYEVNVEMAWINKPYQILRVTSRGKPANSFATCKLRAEFDISDARELYRRIVVEEDP